MTTTDNRFWPGQIVAQIDRFQPTAIDDQIAQDYNLQRLSSETNGLVGRRIVLYRVPDQRDVAAVSQALAADQRIVRAQLNWRYQLNQSAQATTGAGGVQYAIARIRLSGAWAVARGAGVSIAVVDSGIDEHRKELSGGVVKRFDATRGRGAKDVGHGTAIAGILRAHGAVKGIAPESRLLSARAFFGAKGYDGPQSSTAILLRALDWSVASGARVINMSFAGPKDESVAEAIELAARRGTIMVAAAGNGGPKAKPAYPAAYPDVIAVTATDENDQLYVDANRGAYITVAAPGVDVFVLRPGKGHEYASGTSMAAAHVSGLIALMLERNVSLDHSEVKSALVRTARDLGEQGIDTTFGAGRVDAESLLQSIPEKRLPAVPVATTPQ